MVILNSQPPEELYTYTRLLRKLITVVRPINEEKFVNKYSQFSRNNKNLYTNERLPFFCSLRVGLFTSDKFSDN